MITKTHEGGQHQGASGTRDTLTPRDNGASYAGVYGIANNDYALWMLSRGFGELLALTPEEMQKPERAPSCRALGEQHVQQGRKWRWVRKGGKCERPMRIRPEGYVCYEHAEPVRVPRPPRLQEIPFFEGGIEAAIGCEVDLVYTKDDGERKASWKYKLRPLMTGAQDAR